MLKVIRDAAGAVGRGGYTGEENTLGAFITNVRTDRHMAIKSLSKSSDIDAGYIKDVEDGLLSTMGKPDLDKLAEVLGMSTKERHRMYDLAAGGDIPEDIKEYVENNADVRAFLRMTMDGYPAKKVLGKRFIKALPKLPPKEAEKLLASMNKRKNALN